MVVAPIVRSAAPGGTVLADAWGLLRVHPGVRHGEIQAALSALAQIPEADKQLLVRAGVRIELLPVARLEQDRVGATDIGDDERGRTHPTGIRVAAHSGLPLSPTRQIVAHEVGHAVQVLRAQDRSELGAELYVLRVLRSASDQAIAAARMRSEGLPTPPSFAPQGLFGSLVSAVT